MFIFTDQILFMGFAATKREEDFRKENLKRAPGSHVAKAITLNKLPCLLIQTLV